MTLRSLPSSERIFATLAALTLAAALGLGLALTSSRELRATAPGQPPPAQSRLLAVLGSVMSGNASPAETQWWLRQGRPEALWAAWTGFVLLAGTMAAMVAVVLKELWTTPSRSN